MLGSVAPIEGLGWGVVMERPMAEAFATVRSMQQRTILVTAIAALIALAVGPFEFVPVEDVELLEGEVGEVGGDEGGAVSGRGHGQDVDGAAHGQAVSGQPAERAVVPRCRRRLLEAEGAADPPG